MKTTEIISIDGRQAVALPEDFRFGSNVVAIRKDGDRVILEPIKPGQWPVDFFEAIRVDDDAFVRPSQGDLPPVPPLDSE